MIPTSGAPLPKTIGSGDRKAQLNLLPRLVLLILNLIKNVKIGGQQRIKALLPVVIY